MRRTLSVRRSDELWGQQSRWTFSAAC